MKNFSSVRTADGRRAVLSIDVCNLEEVKVRSKDPFGGRGTLEFSDQPHPLTPLPVPSRRCGECGRENLSEQEKTLRRGAKIERRAPRFPSAYEQ